MRPDGLLIQRKHKNIYSLFWILNLTNMCICIYCVRVNETCKFKMALNIKSSISWIHKQTSYFFISWQRILYISCFTNIHRKTWRVIRITVQVLLYQAVASEQCTGFIVEKTLLIHRPVKTIGLMNPGMDEVLVMPYIANLYRQHKNKI